MNNPADAPHLSAKETTAPLESWFSLRLGRPIRVNIQRTKKATTVVVSALRDDQGGYVQWGWAGRDLKSFHTVAAQGVIALERDLRAVGHRSPLLRPIRSTLVMQGLAVGVFAHECFGHSSEADNFLDYHKDLGITLGDRWTVAPLTVHDRPSSELNGGYDVDDEDALPHDAELISDGVWAGLLTDHAHRYLSGGRSTGHGRGFSTAVAPRCSVLTVEADKRSPADLVAELRDGWLLGTATGGYSAGPYLVLKYLWAAPVVDGCADLGRCYGPVMIRARKRALAQRISVIGPHTTSHSTPYQCVKNGYTVGSSFVVPDLLFEDAIVGPAGRRSP